MNLPLASMSKERVSKEDLGYTEQARDMQNQGSVLLTHLQTMDHVCRQGSFQCGQARKMLPVFLVLCLALQHLNKMQTECEPQVKHSPYRLAEGDAGSRLPNRRHYPGSQQRPDLTAAVLLSTMLSRHWGAMANQRELIVPSTLGM